VRLEGFDKLKTSDEFIGNRNRDVPACSIVPQRTTQRLPPDTVYNVIEKQKRNKFISVIQLSGLHV
jgi:hypothetical protein